MPQLQSLVNFLPKSKGSFWGKIISKSPLNELRPRFSPHNRILNLILIIFQKKSKKNV